MRHRHKDGSHAPLATSGGRARRRAPGLLAYGMDHAPGPLKEDERQTRRDLRAALVFGVVAATIELVALLYFFR